MKKLIQELYKTFYKEDLIKVIKEECPVPPKTKSDQLLELAISYIGTDPTPKDEQDDGYACVHSLTTILSKLVPFPIMTYTPTLLSYLKSDPRFREINEFKKGSIVLSPTLTGNGQIVGHVGIYAGNGIILSNLSETGVWSDKFNIVSWIDRYSRKGDLELHIFELL